jgi:hypothetical protein
MSDPAKYERFLNKPIRWLVQEQKNVAHCLLHVNK